MVPGSALRPARPQTPQDAALVRCRVTSHGLSLRLERGGGVSAGLLHFPAGNAARWRHQAHRIIEAGPGASSAAAARWPAPGARASRARTRVVVSGKRPKPKLRGSFPAGGIANPAAQQASAKCSSAADTPAAASRRRIVARARAAEGQPPAPALIAASSLARAGRELGRLCNPGLPGHRPAKGRNVTGNTNHGSFGRKDSKHVRHVTVVADWSRR
jgi:hypothetical protein